MGRRTPKSSRHVRVHALRRARERYGLVLTKSDIDRLEDDIRSRRARFVASLSLSRAVWMVKCQGITMKAVYQRGMGIITFLSHDMTTLAEEELASD